MKRSAFTLVELLIVVVILGILAAVVVPQFSDASTDARVSSLTTNLQTIRGQLELYKLQHNGNYPTLEPNTGIDTCLAICCSPIHCGTGFRLSSDRQALSPGIRRTLMVTARHSSDTLQDRRF